MATGKRLTQLPTINQLLGTEFIYVVDEDGISRQGDITLLKDFVETPEGVLLSENNLNDVQDVPLARQSLGLGTMAVQNSANVDINGGSLDSVVIGENIPDEGTFTDLTVTSTVNVPPASISVNALTGLIPNSLLENDSLTIVAGDGLTGGGTVTLGGTLTLNVDPLDLGEIDGGNF